jgi:hypothetical protein
VVAEGNYVAVYVTAEVDAAALLAMAPPGALPELPAQPPADLPAPEGMFQLVTIDLFRIENGKLAEHWDMGTIVPPAGFTPPA